MGVTSSFLRGIDQGNTWIANLFVLLSVRLVTMKPGRFGSHIWLLEGFDAGDFTRLGFVRLLLLSGMVSASGIRACLDLVDEYLETLYCFYEWRLRSFFEYVV